MSAKKIGMRTIAIGATAVAVGVGTGLWAGLALANDSRASRVERGPLPAEVTQAVGPVDMEKVPLFVETLDQSGSFVGYVESALLFDPDSHPRDGIPVYDESLRRIIGNMIDGKGFVRLGADPDTVPSRKAVVTEPASSIASEASEP